MQRGLKRTGAEISLAEFVTAAKKLRTTLPEAGPDPAAKKYAGKVGVTSRR